MRRATPAALLAGTLACCASLPPVGEPFEGADGWGYRTARGTVTLAPSYIVALPFSPDGIAAVVDASGWAIIDHTGVVLVRPVVVDNGPDEFHESLARFVDNGKVGFFDTHGRIVIPARFDWAAPFHEGRAAFCHVCRTVVEDEHATVVGGRWGYLDRMGRVAVADIFAAAGEFCGGIAQVTYEGRRVAIDRRGAIRRRAPD